MNDHAGAVAAVHRRLVGIEGRIEPAIFLFNCFFPECRALHDPAVPALGVADLHQVVAEFQGVEMVAFLGEAGRVLKQVQSLQHWRSPLCFGRA